MTMLDLTGSLAEGPPLRRGGFPSVSNILERVQKETQMETQGTLICEGN